MQAIEKATSLEQLKTLVKEYDEAIRICNKAIEDLGYFSKDRFEKWNTNLERVIKLKEKEINK